MVTGVFSAGSQRVGITLLVAGVVFCMPYGDVAFAAKPDKTPPVISGIHTESVTHNSALVKWTTDEPADSDIDYGIAPHLNKHGPRDRTLVTEHAIQLSELTPASDYAFCVVSIDAANNRSEQCGNFTTQAEPPSPTDVCPNISGIQSEVPTGYITDADGNCIEAPQPPPSSSGGGGGGARPTIAHVSGLAYPGAQVTAELRGIFFGTSVKEETRASEDGSFELSLEKFYQGLYVFTVTATDPRGDSSAVKSYQFDFLSGDAPLLKEGVVIPPTIRAAKEVVTRGENIEVSGYTQPMKHVYVEMNGVGYEAVSDKDGLYEVAINSAGFLPGRISARARVSERDFSPSIGIVITTASVAEADLNKDGIVNIADMSRFFANPVDMNGDGKVNAADLSIFLKAFAGTN